MASSQVPFESGCQTGMKAHVPFFSQTCRFLSVHTASYSVFQFRSQPSVLISADLVQFLFKLQISPPKPLNLFEIPPSYFSFLLFPLIPGSQRMLFRRRVMGVNGRWQQDRGLGCSRWGVGWRLMMMVVEVVVVVVDGWAVMWNDRRCGGEDVGSWGRSR